MPTIDLPKQQSQQSGRQRLASDSGPSIKNRLAESNTMAGDFRTRSKNSLGSIQVPKAQSLEGPRSPRAYQIQTQTSLSRFPGAIFLDKLRSSPTSPGNVGSPAWHGAPERTEPKNIYGSDVSKIRLLKNPSRTTNPGVGIPPSIHDSCNNSISCAGYSRRGEERAGQRLHTEGELIHEDADTFRERLQRNFRSEMIDAYERDSKRVKRIISKNLTPNQRDRELSRSNRLLMRQYQESCIMILQDIDDTEAIEGALRMGRQRVYGPYNPYAGIEITQIGAGRRSLTFGDMRAYRWTLGVPDDPRMKSDSRRYPQREDGCGVLAGQSGEGMRSRSDVVAASGTSLNTHSIAVAQAPCRTSQNNCSINVLQAQSRAYETTRSRSIVETPGRTVPMHTTTRRMPSEGRPPPPGIRIVQAEPRKQGNHRPTESEVLDGSTDFEDPSGTAQWMASNYLQPNPRTQSIYEQLGRGEPDDH
ncbi:hypothetical protein CC78DRAFT_614779 [Lojkania enalia]|uniref:Uncharacterized protein n=1 Tax=Lojkania enalia TaxID=147567 RepID=A0A9P4N5V0_9PLEO|nr:hypothetical protein CC78DRAFT_614779 [Didymosphaeria enalia]